MDHQKFEQFRIRVGLNQARRGRPRTALPEVRDAGYKDANGKDVLTDGLKPWHERIVDYMILNPHAKIVDVAKFFNATPQWVGRLLKTDAFVDYYQARMKGHQDVMHTTIIHKMQGVAVKSLDKMSDALDSKDATFSSAKEAADLTLKSLGYTHNNGNLSVALNDKNGNNLTVQLGSSAVDEARRRIQARMKTENNIEQDHDQHNYNYVTAAMELPTEAIDVEHARDVTPHDPDES